MTARETAFVTLLKFEQSRQHLDLLINSILNIHNLSAKERRFVSNLVSGVVRHLTFLDWKIGTLYNGNYKKALLKFKIILRLALYEIDFLDFIPPHATVNEYVNLAKKKLPRSQVSTVNAIIRTYLREGKSLQPEKKFKYEDTQLSIRYSFPEWMINRWLGIWGKEFVTKMCVAFNKRPHFDIRINENKISINDFKKQLISAKIDHEQSDHFGNVYKVSAIQRLRQLDFLNNGFCSIQDESGRIVTELMEPISAEETILDACVAPGSKYTALLEKHTQGVSIYGLDIDNNRLKTVRENCIRLNFSDRFLVNGDGKYPPFRNQFDKILIDAPCSGIGTIQKHPDIKWRRRLDEILDFQKLQLSILNEMIIHLKPGGYLIYSTCTIDPSENETVIEEFMKLHKNRYRITSPPEHLMQFATDEGYVRTFPHLHNMEGSFAVKLQKLK